MDSCHIFNFLFSTKKATSELSKCFTNIKSKASDLSPRRSRTRDNSSQSNKSSVRRERSCCCNAAETREQIHYNESTLSPFKQLQVKIASLAPGYGVRKRATSCDARCGTYRATLVKSVEDEEEEEEEKKSVVADKNNNDVDHCQEEIKEADDQTDNTLLSTVVGPLRGANVNRIVMYDEENGLDDKVVSPLAEVFEVVSEWGETRPILRRVSSVSAQSAQELSGLHKSEKKKNETNSETSKEDKRSVYVRSVVQSFESSLSSAELLSKNKQPTKSKPITFVKPLPPPKPIPASKSNLKQQQNNFKKSNKNNSDEKAASNYNIDHLFLDEQFLARFFDKLEPLDRCVAAQVCRKWRNILYANQNYWKDLVNVIDCTQLRREQLVECIINTIQSAKLKHLTSNKPNSDLAQQDADSEAIFFNFNQDDIWRIQELCNRYAHHHRVTTTTKTSSHNSLSRQQTNESQAQHQIEQQQQNHANSFMPNSKSSSIPSQISSTLSSVSISSLLSPLSESNRIDSIREKLYESLENRGFDAICLFGATDDDIEDLVSKMAASGHKRILSGRLTNCSVSDRGLELFVSTFNRIEELELSGCNEITNAIHLKPLTELKRLIITDCINIADGVAQKLIQVSHQLKELTIQAYHLTDAFLEYLSSNSDTHNLRRLELPNCKEITNQSLIIMAKHLPQLEALSISGSTKISDDGIEILAEQARQLKCLDLSWCTRISDSSLECIACDLGETLTDLVLDRNVHITDVGLGYLAAMNKLTLLHIRWCPRITDIGLESLIQAVRSLKYLSIAGIHQITARSLLSLVEAEQLLEVELTNCPAVNYDLIMFLSTKMPRCNIIF